MDSIQSDPKKLKHFKICFSFSGSNTTAVLQKKPIIIKTL